ncbi:MAG TPA: lysophospholipid acyltransferase family protein [Myxococcota bacterium]
MAKYLARWFLRLSGWQVEGGKPYLRRFVLIGAPHTSNWDLVFMLAIAAVLDVKVEWLGKHALFRPPLGWLMRRLGGIPVVRHRQENTVLRMAQTFESRESLALALSAEGTRGYAPYWRSGFYHIARAAGVPIVLGYLDYARRRGGFGPAILPTGDIRSDMDEIRDFYADKVGRHPDRVGEVRLKEEM